MSMSMSLNMNVSEVMMRMMCESAKEVAMVAVRECGKQYKFDAEIAIRELGLESLKAVLSRSNEKSLKGKSVMKEKVATVKSAFPLPYNGEQCNDNCQALRQNNGLYTQCQYKKEKSNDYCKGCQKLAEKSDNGIPEYGTITERTAVGIFDYVDPKGRRPVAYTKIMKKYKLTEEMVQEEAAKHGITIDMQHFARECNDASSKRGRPSSGKEKIVKEKGAKGRPKKEKKSLEIQGDADDLFASLVADMNINDDEVEADQVEEVVVAKKGKSEEEKEAERLAKEQAKKEKEEKASMLAEEKAAKEAKKAEEKAAKEAKAAQEKAEKEAKAAEEKAAKEAKAAEEKAAKEAKKAEEKAAKEAKAAEEKAAKAAKKAAEEQSKAPKKKSDEPKKPKESAKKPTEVAEETEGEPDVVKKIEIDGKKYLKSKNTGIIYDYTEYVKNGDQVVVGKWNDAKNQIDFNEVSDDEEEENEEYDE